MSNIYQIADEFKRRLLARERRAASELVRAYALAVGRIEERINELTTQLTAARRVMKWPISLKLERHSPNY